MLPASGRKISYVGFLSFFTAPVAAHVSGGRPGYGLIGYGISMYDPTCAYACGASVPTTLECNDSLSMDMDMGMGMGDDPSPECLSTNTPFLQTLAYCISTRCQDVDVWKLERYWKENVAGRQIIQPTPKWTYQETLETINNAPNITAISDTTLSEASLIDDDTYISNWNADSTFEWVEDLHNTYGLILFVTGSAIPFAFSLLRFLPFPKRSVTRFNAVFVDPPLFGSRHRQPVLQSGNVPTRGQAIFVGYLFAINIIFCATGYTASNPNSWWSSDTDQIATYIANRTGVLSVANLALLVLYAGRNNVLLWLTDWSHSTFLILHRWVAIISVLQACLHSAIYLALYTIPAFGRDFTGDSKLPYWIWGIVATLAMTLSLPFSLLQIRRKFYEFFIASHVVLALFACIGYYYHIYYRFEHQWGYETWIYIAVAIWGFDRLLRLAKLARNGIRTGYVTIVDDDYVRLDVRGVAASGQAYLYFPTLTWRVWENHPFSVASSLPTHRIGLPSRRSQSQLESSEKTIAKETIASSDDSSTGDQAIDQPSRSHSGPELTFFVRTHSGLTRLLRSRKMLPILVEASYGHSLCHPDGGTDPTSRLVCVAGGVGITALTPLLARHLGRKKLYWGSRSSALVDSVRDIWERSSLTTLDMEVALGKRFDLQEVLGKEVASADDANEDITVIVSGPPGMADEVRTTVARLAKSAKHAAVSFVEESYSW